MKVEPLITVVTVVYNGVCSIEETIINIIQQTYSSLEYIIIDGGSTDGTLAVIEKYRDRISVIKSEPDLGLYDAMNKAMGIASGDFLIFMNSGDTFTTPLVLSNFAEKITDRYAVYYGDAYFIDKGKNSKTNYSFLANKFSIVFHNICHQTVFYPKSVYQFERYDMIYRLFADWEYNIRLMGKSVKFVHMNDYVACFELGGLSSKQDEIFLKNRGKIVRNYLGIIVYIYYVIKDNFRLRRWLGISG
jgi:glycosyltransferase involved in cell wall biosynthesis